MANRNKNANNETDRNQYESLFSAWYNNDLNNNSSIIFDTNFYHQNNILDSSSQSLKSITIKSQSYSHFGNNSVRNQQQNTPNPNNIGTISLTDMIKTNYCHKASKNSQDSLVSYEKITGDINQQNFENFDFKDDGLEEVSNRKLQNRANAKRARERKKGQWQQMKELIQDLQNQNRALKSTLQNNEKIQLKHFQKCQKKWSFCKRCKRQIFYNPNYACQKQGSSVDTQLVKVLNPKGKSKLEEEYLRVFGNRKNYRDLHQEQQRIIQSKQDPIVREKEFFQNTDQQMDVQFEQFDFQPKKKQQQNVFNHHRRWVGKMWIAISLIMLVLGVHMNGFEGSGEKSIRLYEKQARQWVSDFENEDVSSFKIKMKTKIGHTFIENEKGQQKQISKWREKEKWQQKFGPSRQKSQKKKDYQNLWNRISFESQQMYIRELLQQEQTEMQIDKDLLFSIHAELNDIGRYI